MSPTHGIYDLRKTGTRLSIRFSSTMDHIDDVCSSVTLFLEGKGEVFASHLFSINLVMREGLTNAVRHGNRNDPEKIVDFHLEIDPDRKIKVCIADQGEGFDWEAARTAVMPDEADHGRGMPIMETYFNCCRYNKKGNVLYLEKDITPEV